MPLASAFNPLPAPVSAAPLVRLAFFERAQFALSVLDTLETEGDRFQAAACVDARPVSGDEVAKVLCHLIHEKNIRRRKISFRNILRYMSFESGACVKKPMRDPMPRRATT
jgi:hypothetical protein